MKILIFGTGKKAEQIMQQYANFEEYIEVVGFLDNDEIKQDTFFFGKKVFSPSEIKKITYDYICILMNDIKNVYNQLVYGYRIDPKYIKDKYFLLKCIMEKNMRIVVIMISKILFYIGRTIQ